MLKCLLTEDVLLKIENTYRGSEMKIVTLVAQDFQSPNPRIDYKTAFDCSRLTPNSMAEVQEG